MTEEAIESNVEKIELFEGEDEQWYFRGIAGNGEIVVTSEGYKEKASAVEEAEKAFPDVQILRVEK